VDPLTAEYPWYSPYQFAGNGPIANLDVDGKEPISYMSEMKVGSSAINPNWGNYEWMNSHDPKLNQTMTLRHDLNTERWYVWKKTGDPSITGGAVFDPEEYRSSGAWSGRWLEYKTPERVRYEGGIAAAENFEKVVLTTMAATVGLVYVAAAAPLATSAARVAMPHILRGGQWAGNAISRGLNTAWSGEGIFGIERNITTSTLNILSDGISQYVTFKADSDNRGKSFLSNYNILGGIVNAKLKNPFLVDFISSGFSITVAKGFDPTSIPEALIGGAVGGTMGHFQGKYLDPLLDSTKDFRAKIVGFSLGTIGNMFGDAAVKTTGDIQSSNQKQ
jgi:hypothetical protein